jgi:D-alanyl-D-alanine-carboxypeptidase/D-alanyl-D-alanine-endopeptidase
MRFDRGRSGRGVAALLGGAGLVLGGLLASAQSARAENKLLAEAIEFTGSLLFLDMHVPALVIGVVRNGETAVVGFGEIADKSGKAPDGDTLMRIGSNTKAFTGAVLASLVADGTVRLTDRLQDRLGWDVTIPERDGKAIRLVDLATHASGLPREVDRPPGSADDPFGTVTKEACIAALKADPLLFPPGTGVFYSNFAFDLLAQALAHAAGKPYPQLLSERVLQPMGMKDTVFDLRDGDAARVMQGHNFDGSAMPFAPTPPLIAGAGGLYSTTNDMLRWLAWHLDRLATKGAEMRLVDHAAYLWRDGLTPVFALDEAGEMDAMGLGWVIMAPQGSRPLILQKAGGLQGTFSYAAFAPSRGVGVFVAINQFNLAGGLGMMKAANDLIGELAPR